LGYLFLSLKGAGLNDLTGREGEKGIELPSRGRES